MKYNEVIIVASQHRQCMKLAGNITLYLNKDEKIVKRFIKVIQMIETLAPREYDVSTEMKDKSSLRVIGKALAKLTSVYKIAKILAKEFRWVTRMRITERGREYSRVNLDKNRSVVITVRDLHLDKPLYSVMKMAVTEAEIEIKKLIKKSEPLKVE